MCELKELGETVRWQTQQRGNSWDHRLLACAKHQNIGCWQALLEGTRFCATLLA